MPVIQASVVPAIRQSLLPPLELWPGWEAIVNGWVDETGSSWVDEAGATWNEE